MESYSKFLQLDFNMFARDIGLPSLRGIIGMTFFVLEIFLDPRSALIPRQSKQSGLLSLAFPSSPRSNLLSSYSHSCEQPFLFADHKRRWCDSSSSLLFSSYVFLASERRESKICCFFNTLRLRVEQRIHPFLLLKPSSFEKHILATLIAKIQITS